MISKNFKLKPKCTPNLKILQKSPNLDKREENIVCLNLYYNIPNTSTTAKINQNDPKIADMTIKNQDPWLFQIPTICTQNFKIIKKQIPKYWWKRGKCCLKPILKYSKDIYNIKNQPKWPKIADLNIKKIKNRDLFHILVGAPLLGMSRVLLVLSLVSLGRNRRLYLCLFCVKAPASQRREKRKI